MRADPARRAADAPLDELVALLLRQFRRPLAAQGVELADADITVLSAAAAARAPSPQTARVCAALRAAIADSEAVLARWGLTFRQSLQTPMDGIPGWQSTAEFLEIANEKANAELRMGAGAALLAALGDLAHVPYLLDLIAHDPDDLDAAIARRVLALVSGIAPGAPDWAGQVRAWAERQRDG